ncbi:hypothetical protein ACFQBQ_01390 [Granulicella cerasi]|uniref:Uncharacterized protein n=1 Tax=Granulicella cerasi TaxID=741063 RepID=A0ABW1Z4A8_9BACT|nr:hypothetical protein [Granulicella cerasi]
MPYLFAITVVAFVALLWASISTAQYIRRTRRRQKLAQAAEAKGRSALSRQRAMLATEPVAPPPPAIEPTPAQEKTLHDFAEAFRAASEMQQRHAAPPAPPVEAPAPPPPAPAVEAAPAEPAVRFPLSSHRIKAASVAPVTAAEEEPFRPQPTQFPNLRRPVVSPTDWKQFDPGAGGDLTDPEPGRYRR